MVLIAYKVVVLDSYLVGRDGSQIHLAKRLPYLLPHYVAALGYIQLSVDRATSLFTTDFQLRNIYSREKTLMGENVPPSSLIYTTV